MQLNEERGGYARGITVRLDGSFLLTGAGTSPVVIRDGNSKCIASVTFVSTGLFTVKFDAGFPIPERLVSSRVDLVPATAVPAQITNARLVGGTYSSVTRQFQVQLTKVTALADTTPVATNGIAGELVTFSLMGSIHSIGTDPA